MRIMSQAIDAPAWQNCAGCGEVVPDRDPDHPELCCRCGGLPEVDFHPVTARPRAER